MEIINILLTNLEHIRNVVLAIPERKLMPFAAFGPILIFGSMFLWNYTKWYLSNEKTN